MYDRVKTLNKELQSLSKIFLGADVTDVWHTGTSLPYGTKALTTLPEGISALSTSDNGAVVSRVRKDDKAYIAIVNKDYKADMTLDIAFTGETWQIDKEGYKAAAESGRFTVAPGDIVLFQVQ